MEQDPGAPGRWWASRRALAAGAAAVAVAGWLLWPTERYDWAGDVRRLLRFFETQGPSQNLGAHTSQAPLPSQAIAKAFGAAGLPPASLLWLAAASGALYCCAWALVARRLAGGIAGWLCLLFLAVDPERLNWAHAGYHVIQPAALAAGSAALLCTSKPTFAHRLAAAAAIGLAIFWRPNEATTLLPIVLLTLWCEDRPRHRVLTVAVTLGATVTAVALALAIGRNDIIALWLSTRPVATALSNLFHAPTGTPWTEPWILGPLVLLGLAASRNRAAAGALASCLLVWVALASFSDFAPRHTLSLRAFFAALSATAIVHAGRNLGQFGRGAAALVALLTGACLLSGAGAARDSWYRPYEGYPPSVGPTLKVIEEDLGRREVPCIVVVSGVAQFGEESRIELAGRFEDHPPFTLLTPGSLDRWWERTQGCVLWAEPDGPPRWDDRGLKSQVDRLSALATWTVIDRNDIGGGPLLLQRIEPDGSQAASRSVAVRLHRWLLGRGLELHL